MITPELPNNYADQAAEKAVEKFRFSESVADYVDYEDRNDSLSPELKEALICETQECIDQGLEIIDQSPISVTAEEINQAINQVLDSPEGKNLRYTWSPFEEALTQIFLEKIKQKNSRLFELLEKYSQHLLELEDDLFDQLTVYLQMLERLELEENPDAYIDSIESNFAAYANGDLDYFFISEL